MPVRQQNDGLDPFHAKKRVRKPRFRRFAILLALLLFVIFLPKLLTTKAVLVRAIDGFAGLAPLHLDFDKVRAGWLQPVSIFGIQLKDVDGRLLAKVGEVQTEKGLFSWIIHSSQLGEIVVKNFQAEIVADAGTTNIEQAIQPLLDKFQPADPDPAETQSFGISGSIRVLDSRLLLTERGRPEQWLLSIPSLQVALPAAGQATGPIEVQMALQEASGTVRDALGGLAAQIQQTESNALEVRAKADAVPLDFWHVIRARLPDIPVNDLRGRVTAVLAGNILNESAWSFSVSQFEARDLSIVAPLLVGENPAHLQSVSGSANCRLANAVLRMENTQLMCDFASTTASAAIPWPLVPPTASAPFVRGATVSAEGMVDLPKLIAAAESLIPIHEDTQLVSGTAQFSVAQKLDPQGKASCHADFQVSGLEAIQSGQRLAWKDALAIHLAASETERGVGFDASVAAEFANIRGQGSLETGQITGTIDLSLLRERVGQWVALPITTMSGSAGINGRWNLANDEIVVAECELATTPLSIATTTGKELFEPAWSGKFRGQISVIDATPQSIHQANLSLQSREERLIFDLQQPLYLIEPVGQETRAAAFHIDLHTSLANCKRRGTVWLSEPVEMEVNGNLELAADGLVDLNHIEILNANWRGKPIEVFTSQMSFAEPEVVGKFKGRVDSSGITRTVIETLEMTSSSISLIAQDAASADGTDSRVGRARFLLDLGRLLRNTQSGRPSLIPNSLIPTDPNAMQGNASNLSSGAPLTTYSATGRCDGELAWQVNSQAAGIHVLLKATDLVVLSQTPTQQSPQPVWQEPAASTALEGLWTLETNTLNVPQMSLQLPWMNYSGNLNYSSRDDSQSIQVKGQAVYDSAQLSSKLSPFTGRQLQLAGQQTVPIELSWESNPQTDEQSMIGLNAATSLGWQQANVAGIILGKADVPVTVTRGVLATNAEIPVSGGALRWDLQSDLNADEWVLHQKPMTLLENVEITKEMCNGWLKYIAPLLAETARVDGRLSVRVDQAELNPSNPARQNVAGQLIVHNATVGPGPLSNSVINIVQQLDAIRKKDFTQAVSSTQSVWLNMPEQRIDFEMRDGRVVHRNLNVKVGDATILTSGSVGVDGQMQLVAAMPIPDDWAAKSPWLAGLQGQTLEFPIVGTLSKPQVDTQGLRQLGRQTANNLLSQGINRGLDKLLGGQAGALNTNPATPGSPAPGNPLNGNPNTTQQNPILGIGEQILRGEGLNLPGLFGGQNQTPNKN